MSFQHVPLWCFELDTYINSTEHNNCDVWNDIIRNAQDFRTLSFDQKCNLRFATYNSVQNIINMLTKITRL